MPISAQDPSFDPKGHDFALNSLVLPFGEYQCRTCGIPGENWSDNDRPACVDVLALSLEMGHQFAKTGGRGPTETIWGATCLRCGMTIETWHHDAQAQCVAEPADPMADLTPAESMGVLVTQAIAQVEAERDEARATLNETATHLSLVLEVLDEVGTTWSPQTRIMEAARVFLDGLPSVKTPEEGSTP